MLYVKRVLNGYSSIYGEDYRVVILSETPNPRGGYRIQRSGKTVAVAQFEQSPDILDTHLWDAYPGQEVFGSIDTVKVHPYQHKDQVKNTVNVFVPVETGDPTYLDELNKSVRSLGRIPIADSTTTPGRSFELVVGAAKALSVVEEQHVNV